MSSVCLLLCEKKYTFKLLKNFPVGVQSKMCPTSYLSVFRYLDEDPSMEKHKTFKKYCFGLGKCVADACCVLFVVI